MVRRSGRSRVATLAAAIALILAACSPVASQAPGATSGGSPGPTTAASQSATAQYCMAEGFDEAKLFELAKLEGNMVWMANQDLDRAEPMIEAFQEAYPGVRVDYQLTSGDVAERFIAENQAGRLSLDVHNPSIDFVRYREAGMVTDSTDTLLAAKVPAESIVDGIAQDEFLVVGIAYNKDLVAAADVPQTWEDILDPKWKGLLAIDERLRPWIYATPTWGKEKVVDSLTRLKAQEPKFRSGESATVALLLAGESHLMIGTFLGSILEHEDSITVGGRTVPGGGDDPWTWDDQLDEVFTISSPGDGPTYSPTAPHPCASKLWIYWFFGPEATALRDSIRFRADPRPGTNTGPSLYLQEHNQKITMAPPEIDLAFRDMQREYLAVLGITLE